MAVTKVCVVGNTASGKSHLAGLVGERFGLPITHLDAIYWRSDWSHATTEEFLAAQRDLISGQKWVLDGCFSEFGLESRFQAADAILFLDMPSWSCLRRAVSRRGDNRTDTPADDRLLPLGLGLLFLVEIIVFKLVERPRVLSAGKRCGTPFIRIRRWADEDQALLALRDVI